MLRLLDKINEKQFHGRWNAGGLLQIARYSTWKNSKAGEHWKTYHLYWE